MPHQRFCLRLDPEILLEGLILERLDQIPKSRRPEWLRGLLASGFLAESRIFREATGKHTASDGRETRTDRQSGIPRSPFGNWLSQPMRPGGAGKSSAPQAPVAKPAAVGSAKPTKQTKQANPTTEKPFAHLRKVIG